MNHRRPLHFLERTESAGDRVAVVDSEGRHSYRELLSASGRAASALLDGRDDLREARAAFLTPPGFEYTITQWGIWRGGGIAVPLCTQHPSLELEYVLDDAQASIAVAHPQFEERLRPLAERRGIRILRTDSMIAAAHASLPAVDPDRRAMMLYTSGTTGRPKGVVTTHRNIESQIASLVRAWEWSSADHTLHVLPLHHIHGIVNILGCALWVGATCEMMRKFDAGEVWARFAQGGITHRC